MARRPLSHVWPWSVLGKHAGVFRTFGEHGRHGADLSCPVGSTVPAPRAGVVFALGWIGPRDAGDRRSLGYGFVLHDPALNEWWLAGHGAGKYLVGRGTLVPQGHPIMLSGNSGYSGGPHVHLERWANVPWPGKGKLLDPLAGTIYASSAAPFRAGAGGGGGAPASLKPRTLPRGWYAR